jgi:hypothetical protein
MIWQSVSDTEVECSHWEFYYDNKVNVNSMEVDVDAKQSPSVILDCIHRFRFEGDRWRMSYRFYGWTYVAVTPTYRVGEASGKS